MIQEELEKLYYKLNIKVNFSSYTLEDLDHPRLVTFYGIFWDVTLPINTLFFLIMMWVIIKKSTSEMGGYKWYLCHQLVWSYLFDLYMSLWKPISLAPFFVGYSSGILRNVSIGTGILPMVVVTFLFLGMAISISMSFFHRLYNISWIRWSNTIIAFVVIQACFCTPLYVNAVDIASLRASLTLQNEAIGIFFDREPSIFGFDPAMNENGSFMFSCIMVLGFVALFILITIMYLNYLRILHKNRANISTATYRLQKVLFKTICLQIVLALIMLIPLTASMVLALMDVRWVSQFSLWAYMLLALHTIMDFAVMSWFIKPYRVFFIDLGKAGLKRLGFKLKDRVAPLNAMVSTTQDNIIVDRED